MSRIQIPKAEIELYKTTYTISVGDLNYGNHLGNDRILFIAQEARMRWLKSKGYSEINFFGTSLIQVDAGINYRSEGFYANDIEILLGISDVSTSSFDLIYSMFNLTTNRELAAVKTRMVCYNYDLQKVQPIPDKFRQMIFS